jgi:uncharacterized protein (DUF2249 family)
MSVTLSKARTIIRKAFEKGAELELKPLSVVVLDAGKVVQQGKAEEVFRDTTPQCLITLKGTLVKKEHTASGTWLTIENGDNVWRVPADDGHANYHIAEEVTFKIEATAIKLTKKK